MESIIRGRHSIGGSNYHLRFTPKYRQRVFEDRIIQEECKKVFHEIAWKLDVKLTCVEFGPEHAHLFVEGCKNYAVCKPAQYFKGASSRYLRHHLWKKVSKYEWGDSFWSDGYFYESIGRVTADTVKFYIERQQKKHWIHIDGDIQSQRHITRSMIQSTIDHFAS